MATAFNTAAFVREMARSTLALLRDVALLPARAIGSYRAQTHSMAERRAAGICVTCDTPALEGDEQCADCRLDRMIW